VDADTDTNPGQEADAEHLLQVSGTWTPACYGWLAVVSDVDDDGFALNVDNESEGLPCYIEASTTERCWDRGGRDAHKVDECTE
jgi:hypothetical protein